MNEFIQSFEEYLLSRVQEAIDQQKRENQWYKALLDRSRQTLPQVEEVVKALPEQDQELLNGFLENEFHLRAEEEMVIYHQGLKDGVRVLRYLEAL